MPSERRSIGEVARDWLGAATDVLNRGLVAGVVGAPVDIASTVLRPFVPGIGDAPVGGSEWIGNKMQQAGIVSSKRRPIAEFAASLIDPATAPAAIAKGASLGAAKLSMLPLAIGQTVWHGSPHKFAKFDSSKIGTGEGAQAYGHGLYLAESPSVAKSYADSLSQYHIATKDGVRGGGDFADALVANAGEYPASLSSAIRSQANKIATDIASGKPTEQVLASMRNGPYARMYAGLADAVEKLAPSKAGGSLYKVDLPDNAIARMLDWDKPLSQQPEAFKAAVSAREQKRMLPILEQRKAALAGLPPDAPNAAILKKQIAILEDEIKQAQPVPSMTGGEYFNYLRRREMQPAEQAEWLRQAGIPGIRYLDGGSRGTGQGTSNFVIFPGNEDLLTILERNGVPIVPDSK